MIEEWSSMVLCNEVPYSHELKSAFTGIWIFDLVKYQSGVVTGSLLEKAMHMLLNALDVSLQNDSWTAKVTSQKETPITATFLSSQSAVYLYEPAHDKTNKIACAPSEDSDQPGHPPSLIQSSLHALWVAKFPSFLYADCKDSDQTDQTGWMLRLI